LDLGVISGIQMVVCLLGLGKGKLAGLFAGSELAPTNVCLKTSLGGLLFQRVVV
jgi:hypothetical protein